MTPPPTHSPDPVRPRTPGRPPRGAFTLIEVVVVVVIIVLLLGMAVPAFNYITGNRSTDAAQNTVAAALSRARTEAIYRGKPVGVAFYRDPIQDRTAVALVTHPDIQPWNATVGGTTGYFDRKTAAADEFESFVTQG